MDERLRRARIAVSVLFVVNGALLSTVIPRLPAIKADLHLSNASLGVAVGAAAFGALLAGPFTGRAVAKAGSGSLAVATGVLYGVVLVLFGVAPGWPALAAVFLSVGVLDVQMDVAMNAHGLRVQRLYRRSIFNVFHACWSIGAAAGAAVGAGAAALGVPIAAHLLAVGWLLAAASLAAKPWLLHGPEDATEPAEPVLAEAGLLPGGLTLLRALAPFAVLSVVAAMVEDVPGSFGAVYLRDALGAGPGLAGLGYVGFATGMAVGRLRADLLVDRHGAAFVVRAGNLLAAIGLGVALLLDQPAAAVAGLTAVGVGSSSTIPWLFVAAGTAARRSADGIALVSWATRVGFLVSPVVVGIVADAAGLAVGVALCAVAATVIALTSGRAVPSG